MIRTQEATGKTVDEARAKACALLGVQADDLNVSYEVLEMPQKTGFLGLKTTPAKVRVSVEEPDAPAAPVVEEKVEPEVKPVVEETPAEEPKAEEPAAAPVAEEAAPVEETAAPAAEGEEPEVPINIEENAKVKAAVDYLKEVIALMGVENAVYSPEGWEKQYDRHKANSLSAGTEYKAFFRFSQREEQGRIDGIETEKQKRNTVCRQRTPADLDHLYIAFRELGDDGRGTERHSQPEDRAEDS